MASHSESSSAECRLSAGWPPTLRPIQPTWTLSQPEKEATIRIHHRHLSLFSPKADTTFYHLSSFEGPSQFFRGRQNPPSTMTLGYHSSSPVTLNCNSIVPRGEFRISERGITLTFTIFSVNLYNHGHI